jgi:hypothetical protein
MPHCTACGQQLDNTARFCAGCGTAVSGACHDNNNNDYNNNPAYRQHAPRGRQGHAEGLAAFRQLVDQRWASARKRRGVLRSVFLLLVVLCIATAGFLNWVPLLGVPFLLIAMLIFSGSVAEPRLSTTEYQRLPGAWSSQGQHRCLQCGHGGIHRKTPYQTNTTLANCSKCQASLWAE